MAKNSRSGCFPYVLGGAFGGVLGPMAAVLIGVLHAPTVNPDDSLAHEWYTPLVLIVLPFYGLIVGVMIGLFARNAYTVCGGRALVYGAAGLILGLAAGGAVFSSQGDTSDIFTHGLSACALTFGGLLFAGMTAESPVRHNDEL